jgi:radical SAM superfamily enzyme YgiQ (UPF0313 family)
MKIQKIAFINPSTYACSEEHMYTMYKRNINNYKPYLAPPLNLLTIASYTPDHIQVKIIDENIEQIDFNEDYDLVGITAMTQQSSRAYQIAGEFRKRNIPVVMGGIHASVLPEEALMHVDTVFIGEAEEQWGLYLTDLQQGHEKRIYKNEHLFDLGKAKTPKYELINYELFKSREAFIRLIPVQATRGCPHDCSFCIVPDMYGKCIRKKSIPQVIQEIEYQKKLNYNSLLLFVDDNLFVDRKYIKSLMTELIPLKINYIAQTDIKVANDPELLKLAYRSGCVLMLIGFESIDSLNLGEINANQWKLKQLDSYAGSIRKIQENGIIVFGSFIVGFEHDNDQTFKNIRDFVIENRISAHFTMLTALPGSRLYKQFVALQKFQKDVFWDDLTFYSLNFKHKNLDKHAAENGIVWLYDEIYNDANSNKRYRHMLEIFKKLQPRWV